MKKLLELGNFYVSNFVKETPENLGKYSLDVILDEELQCPRLREVAPMDDMYGQYWYRSGINESMRKQLKEITEEITGRIKYKKNDIWLDIACNDGTMFDFIPNDFVKIGIDPADNTFLEIASKKAIIVQDFFSKRCYDLAIENQRFFSLENKVTAVEPFQKAKVITVIAMFYDLDNPYSFLDDINEVLDDDGLLVMQMSYTPLMLEQLAFDNICHEHVYYYNLNALSTLLSKKDLKVVDCSINDTNGGSFRIYIQKEKANIKSFGTAPLRDVCNYRVDSILSIEDNIDFYGIEPNWKMFAHNLNNLKIQTTEFIKEEKAKGKTIYGYGASTKGNTLLQYFNLDSSLITAIAERSPAKFGLKTVGANIPIISEEEMRKANPDYLLILPWHFIDVFVEREKELLENGCKFIVPCPKFEIIEK